MDSKGKVAQVAYPNIVFCVDNFEDIFSQIFTSKQGQKVAVQLLATNEVSKVLYYTIRDSERDSLSLSLSPSLPLSLFQSVSLEKLVFLGAIDHTTLMETVDEKEQVPYFPIIKRMRLYLHRKKTCA